MIGRQHVPTKVASTLILQLQLAAHIYTVDLTGRKYGMDGGLR